MKRAALFIGINSYKLPINNLACAREDAAALYQLFLKDYTPGLVHFLADPNSDAIVDKLKSIMKELQAGDLFLIYFSGHGIEERNNHYLLSSQAERFGDEWHQVLSINALKQITRKRGVQTVFILDSCREHIFEGARNVAGAEATRGVTIGQLVQTADADYLAPVVLCSCAGGEMAYEVKDIQHGIFTLALIDLLSGAEYASLDDITCKVAIRMRDLLKQYGLKGHQTPEVIKSPLVNPILWGNAQTAETTPSQTVQARSQTPVQPVAQPDDTKYNAKDYKVKFQEVRDILATSIFDQTEQKKHMDLLQEIQQSHDHNELLHAYTLLLSLHANCVEARDIYEANSLKKYIDEQLPALKEFLPSYFEIDYSLACGDLRNRKYRQAYEKMKKLTARDFPAAQKKKAERDRQIMQQQQKKEAAKKAEIRRQEWREKWERWRKGFKKFCIIAAIVAIPLSIVSISHYIDYKDNQKAEIEEQQFDQEWERTKYFNTWWDKNKLNFRALITYPWGGYPYDWEEVSESQQRKVFDYLWSLQEYDKNDEESYRRAWNAFKKEWEQNREDYLKKEQKKREEQGKKNYNPYNYNGF